MHFFKLYSNTPRQKLSTPLPPFLSLCHFLYLFLFLYLYLYFDY